VEKACESEAGLVKKTYVGLKEFCALTGDFEQTISYYHKHKHQALGRPLDFIREKHYSLRNRHPKKHLYAKEDGEAIAKWKEARRTTAERAVKFIKTRLLNGGMRDADLKSLGRKEGFSVHVIRAAKAAAGVQTRRLRERGPVICYLKGTDSSVVQEVLPSEN